MKKRILSALLAVCLVVGMVPATLLTAGAASAATSVASLSVTVTDPAAGQAVPKLDDVAVTGNSNITFDVTGVTTSNSADGVWTANRTPGLTIKFLYNTVDYTFDTAAVKTSLASDTNWTWNFSASGGTGTLTGTYKKGATNTQLGSNNTQTNVLNYIDGKQSISVTQNSITVLKGQSVKVNATAVISNTSTSADGSAGGAVTGKVTDATSGYATVTGSNTLTITGKEVGTAYIDLTAAISGNYNRVTESDKITVTVVAGATVTVKANETTLTYGETPSDSTTLLPTAVVNGVTVSKDGATTGTATWKWASSNTAVATVCSNGKVTAVGAGTTQITATYYDGTNDIGVSKPITITVEKAAIEMPIVQNSEVLPYVSGGYNFATGGFIEVPNATNPTHYTIAPATNVIASGTHTVTVALADPNNYKWTNNSSADLTYQFTIGQKALVSIADPSITVDVDNDAGTDDIIYDGTDPEQMAADIADKVTVTQHTSSDTNVTLVNGVDYTLSYSTPTVGVLYLTVNGIGNYSGSRSASYVNIKAGTFTVGASGSLTVAKGGSVNLANALAITESGGDGKVTDISAAKLQNLTFTLTDEADAAYAKISGTTLTPTNAAGDNQTIRVTATWGPNYNVGGTTAAEYTTASSTNTITVTVRASNMITKVTAPTGNSGLVYSGKAQALVTIPNNALYTAAVASVNTADSGTSINGVNATAAGTYKITLTLKAAAADGTTPIWADGTPGAKDIYVTIAKATPTGVPSYTNVKADNIALSSITLGLGSIKGVGADSFSSMTPNWDYGSQVLANTTVTEGMAYNWVFKVNGSLADNYNELRGSIVLWGEAEEEEEDEDDWETTVTNADGSVTVTKYDGETKETVATTTGAYTTSVVTYKNGVLSSITATSTRAGAMAYVPLNSGYVRWDSLVYVNNAVEQDALPADGLTGMYVPLPVGASTLRVTTDGYIFSDVSVGSYFGPSVYIASSRNLIQGTSTTGFVYSPTYTLLRGQVMTILGRYSGAVSMASSTGSTWYVPGVQWALSTGVATENRYSDNASREEMAVMLYNHYRNVLGGAAYTGSSAAYAFTDYNSISAGARTAVAWCYANGIIEGNSTNLSVNTFAPQATILRRDAACMAARYLYVVNGLPIPSAIA